MREFAQANLGLVQPASIRLGTGQVGLEFGIVDDSALLEVDEQHLPGL